MKKNLVFLSALILGVLMISVVCAGWFDFTGKAVKADTENLDDPGEKVRDDSQIILYEGKLKVITLEGKGYNLLAISVEKTSALINVDGVVKELQVLETAEIGNLKIDLISTRTPFFGRNYAVIKASPLSSSDGGGGAGVIICDSNVDCPDSEIGEFVCNGEGRYCALTKDYSCINKECVVTSAGEICSMGDCPDEDQTFILEEGSVALIEDTSVSIEYIGPTVVKLSIGGEITNALFEGESYVSQGGILWTVEDIMYNSKEGGISQVEISYELPIVDDRDEVTYQGILDMLGSCSIHTYEEIDLDGNGLTTGNEVCQSRGKSCILAEIYYDSLASSNWTVNQYTLQDWSSTLSQCNTNNDHSVLRTVCCSVPI